MNTSIPSLVSIADRNLHTKRRNHWLRGLNSTALKGYEPIIRKRVQQLANILEDIGRSRGDIDLSQLIGYFSSVWSCLFSDETDSLYYRYDFMSDMA